MGWRSWEWLEDAGKAIELLRRIDNGDEKAYAEIEPLLKKLDKREADKRQEEERVQQAKVKRATTGRKNSGLFEIAGRHEEGVDHGADGIVLLRKGKMRLVWRYASHYWSSMMEPNAYAPPDLEVLYPKEERANRGNSYLPGQITDYHRQKLAGKDIGRVRLTSALILEHASKIDKVFGKGSAAHAAELKKTVVL